MKHIILAFDSFKGSLTSREAGEAFASGWRECAPDARFMLVVVADGGEGTTEAIVDAMSGEYREVEVSDPIGRRIVARYGVVDGGDTAILDVAAASGLTLLSNEERNPMATSSYGTGELLAAAIRSGCRRVYVGLGGSATNDGGLGMLRALGYRFFTADGEELAGCGADLCRVERIDGSRVMSELGLVDIVVAADVDNPLYGNRGAAYVFARQKGADKAMTEALDCGLRHYAEVVGRYVNNDASGCEGAGAAGGIGFAFMAMLGARAERGVERVLNLQHFDELLSEADLVVTGEGRIDNQTLMGKVPYGVLQRAQRCGVPTIAVGGSVQMSAELADSGFEAIYAATPDGMSLADAMHSDTAKKNMRRIAAHIAQKYSK